jgi:outer membrane protein
MRVGLGAVGVLVVSSVATAAAPAVQSPPPAASTQDPVPELPADDNVEEVVGPSPGAATLTLAQAVDKALTGNFGLLSAADSVSSSRFHESSSLAEFFPKLTPRYQRSDEDSSLFLDASQRLPWSGGTFIASGSLRSSPASTVAPTRSSDLRFVLTQPLLRGFGPNATYFNLRNSRRSRQSQERSFELSRQRLAIQVTAAFYQVIQQRQLLAVAQQSLRRSEDLMRASEARLKVGLVSKLDVYRAELQASQAQDSMVRSQANLATALEQFRALLGLSPTDTVEPEAAELPDVTESDTEPLEALLQRALANRLELIESRDQVGDAQRSASLAKQNLFPQLDLNVGFTKAGFGPTFSDAFRAADGRLDVFFSTSYPLERSSDRASRAIAEIEVQARSRGLRQRQIEIEAEVRAAVRELERIRKSVDLQRKAVEIAQQQRRLATLRYQRGLASNFDVVDAEGSLVLARSALVGLLTSHQVARVELLRAVGSLDVTREFQP